MFSKLIDNYIKNLTKKDIIDFSKQHNIILNNNEIDIIYNTIKSDYKILLYNDENIIFNNLKSRINPTSYNKIINLFKEYKSIYQKYL